MTKQVLSFKKQNCHRILNIRHGLIFAQMNFMGSLFLRKVGEGCINNHDEKQKFAKKKKKK